MSFSLKLLGGASLEGERGTVGGRAARGQRMALLALLAAADTPVLSRDKLIALLWPDCDDERARHLLSQAIYLLRQGLGRDVVLGAGDGVRLNPERVRSDVQEFAEALAAGDRERTVTLYRGPFLDGFFLSGTPEFERWADERRCWFARGYAQALEALARQCEGQGNPRAAVEWWRRLAAHEPYCSRVALRLMAALETTGDRAAALQHARVHELLLREEIGAEPDPEVAAFAERLRGEPARARAPTPDADARSGVAPEPFADAIAVSAFAPPAGDRPPAAATVRPRGGLPAPAGADPPALAGHGPSAPAAGSNSVPRLAARRAAVAAALLLVLSVAFVVPRQRANSGGAVPILAILPFADLGTGADDAYFVDGIHEDLLTSISSLSALRVISRTSVLAYRGSDVNLRQIARELGATHALVGSVRRENDRVRITAQLVDARADHHLWAERYHLEVGEIFAVKGEIIQRIAEVLQLDLTPGEQRRIAAVPTQAFAAFDLYLQAVDYARRYRQEDMEIAIGLLQRAIAVDPGLALAHARLASTHAVRAELFGGAPEWKDSALAMAHRAIRMDPDLAEAHQALGTAHLARGEPEQARPAFERALQLNPSLAAPAGNLGALHGRSGAHDLSVRWYRRAAELHPRSPMVFASLAWNYAILGLFPMAEEAMQWSLTLQPDLPPTARQHAVLLAILQGQLDRAIRESDLMVSANPADPTGWVFAGNTRLLAGDVNAAKEYLERAYTLSSTAAGLAPVAVLLGHACLATGETERGRALLRSYLEGARADLASGNAGNAHRYGVAAAHALLGDRRQANHWIRAFVEGGAGIHRLRVQDPLLASLHGDREFERAREAANARLDGMRLHVEAMDRRYAQAGLDQRRTGR
jgi:TolB-like protein/DNA-binding SARP family transcriptional activator/Flp pilus assembly protein TadD